MKWVSNGGFAHLPDTDHYAVCGADISCAQEAGTRVRCSACVRRAAQ